MFLNKKYFNLELTDEYLYVIWKKSTSNINDYKFLECLQTIGNNIEKAKRTKILVNTLNLGVLINEDLMNNMLKIWIPFLNNITHLAVIVDQNDPIKLMGINNLLEEEMKLIKISAHIFNNKKEAENWLQSK